MRTLIQDVRYGIRTLLHNPGFTLVAVLALGPRAIPRLSDIRIDPAISARVGQSALSRPLEFHTVNGGIDVELPSDVNANVHASTVNGHISTDFPLMIRGKFSNRQLSGAIELHRAN